MCPPIFRLPGHQGFQWQILTLFSFCVQSFQWLSGDVCFCKGIGIRHIGLAILRLILPKWLVLPPIQLARYLNDLLLKKTFKQNCFMKIISKVIMSVIMRLTVFHPIIIWKGCTLLEVPKDNLSCTRWFPKKYFRNEQKVLKWTAVATVTLLRQTISVHEHLFTAVVPDPMHVESVCNT